MKSSIGRPLGVLFLTFFSMEQLDLFKQKKEPGPPKKYFARLFHLQIEEIEKEYEKLKGITFKNPVNQIQLIKDRIELRKIIDQKNGEFFAEMAKLSK